MRRAVTAVLTPFWVAGATVGCLWAVARWCGAAAADGYSQTLKWKWAPALGAGLLVLGVATVVVW